METEHKSDFYPESVEMDELHRREREKYQNSGTPLQDCCPWKPICCCITCLVLIILLTGIIIWAIIIANPPALTITPDTSESQIVFAGDSLEFSVPKNRAMDFHAFAVNWCLFSIPKPQEDNTTNTSKCISKPSMDQLCNQFWSNETFQKNVSCILNGTDLNFTIPSISNPNPLLQLCVGVRGEYDSRLPRTPKVTPIAHPINIASLRSTTILISDSDITSEGNTSLILLQSPNLTTITNGSFLLHDEGEFIYEVVNVTITSNHYLVDVVPGALIDVFEDLPLPGATTCANSSNSSFANLSHPSAFMFAAAEEAEPTDYSFSVSILNTEFKLSDISNLLTGSYIKPSGQIQCNYPFSGSISTSATFGLQCAVQLSIDSNLQANVPVNIQDIPLKEISLGGIIKDAFKNIGSGSKIWEKYGKKIAKFSKVLALDIGLEATLSIETTAQFNAWFKKDLLVDFELICTVNPLHPTQSTCSRKFNVIRDNVDSGHDLKGCDDSITVSIKLNIERSFFGAIDLSVFPIAVNHWDDNVSPPKDTLHSYTFQDVCSCDPTGICNARASTLVGFSSGIDIDIGLGKLWKIPKISLTNGFDVEYGAKLISVSCTRPACRRMFKCTNPQTNQCTNVTGLETSTDVYDTLSSCQINCIPYGYNCSTSTGRCSYGTYGTYLTSSQCSANCVKLGYSCNNNFQCELVPGGSYSTLSSCQNACNCPCSTNSAQCCGCRPGTLCAGSCSFLCPSNNMKCACNL